MQGQSGRVCCMCAWDCTCGRSLIHTENSLWGLQSRPLCGHNSQRLQHCLCVQIHLWSEPEAPGSSFWLWLSISTQRDEKLSRLIIAYQVSWLAEWWKAGCVCSRSALLCVCGGCGPPSTFVFYSIFSIWSLTSLSLRSSLSQLSPAPKSLRQQRQPSSR